jgi:hypothetical protein
MNQAAWVKRARSLAVSINSCSKCTVVNHTPPLGKAAFQGDGGKGGAGEASRKGIKSRMSETKGFAAAIALEDWPKTADRMTRSSRK